MHALPNNSAIFIFHFCLFYTVVIAISQKKIRFPLAFGESGGENGRRDKRIENRAETAAADNLEKQSERTGEVGVGDKKMKKNKLLILLIILNIITITFLFYTCWLISLWKMPAKIEAEFAAKLWAESMYNKKMISKLRLVLKDEPEPSVAKPTEFDGPYVIIECDAYTHPLLGGRNSPSVKMGRIIVETYNAEMKEMYEHPEEYNKQVEYEAELWQKKILGKNDTYNKPEEVNNK